MRLPPRNRRLASHVPAAVDGRELPLIQCLAAASPRTDRHWLRAGMLAIAVTVLLAACATKPKPKAVAGKLEQHIDAAVPLLVKSDEVDSLAAAALLDLEHRREAAWPLIVRAVADAPTRTDLLWLQLQICKVTRRCDPLPIESSLRSLDAGNAYGWMGTLSRAAASKDAAGTQAALVAIARGQRFDVYWTTLNARLALAVVRTKKLSFIEAQQTIVGGLVSRVLPDYGVLTGACKGNALSEDSTRAACRAVAAVLEHGDTYLTEMVGVQIALGAWPEGSPEWQVATRERRLYEYTSNLWAKVSGGLGDASMAERYFLLCAQYHREQDVWRAQIVEAGQSPDPPPDQ